MAAVLGLAAGAAITMVVSGGSSGSGGASTDLEKSQQLFAAMGNLFSSAYPAEMKVGALPADFPAGLVDVARKAADAELVGGFAMPNGAGNGPIETVFWTTGTAVDAVPLVRDAAVAAGWRTTEVFMSGPTNGAAALVCAGDGDGKPAFIVSGVEQDGRQVLTLRLMGTMVVGANPCPASKSGS